MTKTIRLNIGFDLKYCPECKVVYYKLKECKCIENGKLLDEFMEDEK